MISKSLPGCFGIELSKIDLSASLSNDEIANIKKLFQDLHLIVFKEQNLNDDDLKFIDQFKLRLSEIKLILKKNQISQYLFSKKIYPIFFKLN